MNVRPHSLLMVASLLFAGSCLLSAPGDATEPPANEVAAPAEAHPDVDLEKDVTQGALRIVDKKGGIVECPLKHTDVQAEISGFIARVRVTQTFYNPLDERIEAVYVFPLPHQSAVDEMTMVLDDRRIVGVIKRRAEARQIYEQALQAGQTAALLEQERPNIFTQSVGNIGPSQEVRIEISYVDVLDYDMGSYQFHFPMVVGPRYIPGQPSASPQPAPELQGKVSPPVANTTRVPDADRITPPVLRPEYRNGHDISLAVSLDAGVPIQNLQVTNHDASIDKSGDRQAAVTLSAADSLPNKDFVLRYDVVGKRPEMAVLAHNLAANGESGAAIDERGYFMLMIQPQEDERLKKSPPREIVFLVDVSGSMSGEPTAKVREAMSHMLKLCRPQDTLQVVTFAGHADHLFEKPVPADQANIAKALNFSEGFQGSGGTEMLKGVKMAIDQPLDKKRLRIVVMLTDGYIGNEAEIIEHVGKHAGDRIRFWAIGIGSSPNMFLIDGVARQGGGMGKRLGLNDDSQSLTQEIMTRIQRAQLADIRIDWGQFRVSETFPARLPELWAGRPVILYGRYLSAGSGTIQIQGDVEGEPVTWPLEIQLPAEQSEHDVLAKVWARQKIESLMQQTYYAGSPAVEEEVTGLALQYRLMSPYTSFVAVDSEQAAASDAPLPPPRRMLVPVPLPEGTRWEGFFGGGYGEQKATSGVANARFLGEGLSPATMFRDGSVQMSAPASRALRGGEVRLRQLALSSAPAQQSLSRLGRSSRRAGGAYGGAAGAGFEAAEEAQFGYASQIGAPADRDEAAKDYQRVAVNYGQAALQQNTEGLTAAISQATEAARKAQQQGDLSLARSYYTLTLLLDHAAAARGVSNGQAAAEALRQIQELHERQVQDWNKALPALNQRLDVVLRNQALSEALQKLSSAAGVPIELQEGSIDDVQALLERERVHVTYLNLQGATLAQSLDWTLHPLRLNWTVQDGRIVVQSQRRSDGQSAWVYNVANLAFPEVDLQNNSDYAKLLEEQTNALNQFLNVVRGRLGADESQAAWYGPGQLLVFGTAQRHAATAELLEQLANPEARFDGPAAQLHAATVKRATARRDDAQRRIEANERHAVISAHHEFSWQLLAGILAGELDEEAVAELTFAWQAKETRELLKDHPALLLRSWYALSEAARTFPEQEQVRQLHAAAHSLVRPAVLATGGSDGDEQQNVAALITMLYAVLAMPEDEQVPAHAKGLLQAEPDSQSETAALVRLLARVLTGEATDADRQKLTELDPALVRGEDLVALSALACQRAGGQAWDSFRAHAPQLLGNQPLNGHVVVLANRLR